MKLAEICEELTYTCLQGEMEKEISDIIYDSRKVEKDTVFVCMVGAVVDGHDFVEDAVKKGASALVVEHAVEADIPESCTVLQVEDARYALAIMSAAFFGHPDRELTTIGLTGTKGKTTTTYMIKSVLEEAGRKVGLIGTIGALIGEEKLPAKNTTPESYELHKMFRAMVDAGCEYVVMEVSSQGLKMHRVAGIVFDYGIFTNLSPDHIGPNEHATFEEYQECKSMLFRQCKVGIVNADDEHVDGIVKNHTCKLYTFSCEKEADLMAGAIGYLDEEGQIGMHFTTTGCMNVYAVVHIPGSFSVYNSLVTMLTCHLAGISDEAILRGLDKVKVRGRVELVPVSKDFTVIIDYAHNEVSTRSVLTTLKEYHPKRLICVYGGGGNRSKLRRYDMGEVTGELADLSVLTCDNPRDEEIRDINNDIKIGLAKSNGKYIEIDDRKAAIKYCIENAKKGDMIVLLGKGHEDYQEIKGVKYHFDEREAIAEIKKELNL
ncbi:UDP-N-acetylmuramoyl-L-alanyl-D-glutamate--2,6-diaminopimelate ligase [Roseburia sp. AF20-18LB]|uniref:UDP-N-acetylmuramoyl-L-alanyl-D-glutamate--2, 6-diaminopimelate ligase n=1 Tax=Roseburia sp. AF20-18LB TaxID=2293129 RepID=UPI000E49B3F8|nr:UDP-N-acetylmuramoyl-L-alanyl-D-glutamate--2,6-diaminopimelate ligase [Roseburia sp. AF20-18LB]RGG47923.1 UDP-N-acetylmuramoyl-L-alanyl-D-glutamate--2,6-diaminopimelate ligase [Roseburia sp. AF20-18LB]